MRVISSEMTELVFAHRPFAGGLGVSLYVGAGSADAINYRRNRILDGADGLIANLDGETDLGATSFAKCQAVAQIEQPDTELEYSLPADLLDVDVWAQVRTFRDDWENESLYRPKQITVDSGGDGADGIVGVARIISLEKRDGGGLRVLFVYEASRDGLQPETFTIEKTSGAGSVGIVEVTAYVGVRDYTADVTNLTDGVAYTFSLIGHSGSVDTPLLTGIAFTGDSDGPGTVTGLVAEEY